MDNIIENNKLIAEFMGVFDKILSTGNIHSWSDAPFYYTTEDTKGKVIKNICKYSKYDSDWTWLMPVVEKIEQLKNGYGFTFSVKISGNYCTIESYNYSLIVRIVECNNITKFKSVYNACIEFIKWYNEQNKNNEKHTCIIDK